MEGLIGAPASCEFIGNPERLRKDARAGSTVTDYTPKKTANTRSLVENNRASTKLLAVKSLSGDTILALKPRRLVSPHLAFSPRIRRIEPPTLVRPAAPLPGFISVAGRMRVAGV